MFKASMKKRSVETNEYGNNIYSWIDIGEIRGYLDFITIRKGQIAQKFVEDSTHVFITEDIVDLEQGDRLVINGKTYEINYVDNPLNLNRHLEIELKPVLDSENTYEYIFYLGSTDSINITDGDILNFEQLTMKTKTLTKELEITNNILHIIYPAILGKSSIRLNNLLITDWTVNETVVNGVTVLHYCKEVEDSKIKIELY